MMKRLTLAVAAAALTAAARAQDAPPAKAALGADARQDVSVTVYNNNYGLVRETRKGALPKGVVELEFGGVAEKIDPTSVSFRSATAPGEIAILEQNYRYDLLNPQTLMEKNVGRKIAYSIPELAGNTTTYRKREGTLLSTNGGAIVQFENSIEINPPGTASFSETPPGLVSKPTLVWLLRNDHEGEQAIEASYLTNEMNWKADYVAVIAADESKLDLTGWVTLVNQSGASYKNAELKLVAGDVQRTQPLPPGRTRMMAAEKAASPEDAFAEKSFFDYHLYTLGRRTDLLDKETKQMTLLEGHGVAVKKIYSVSSTPYDASAAGKGPSIRKMAVSLEFENDEKGGLGMALPRGRVRAYKADSDGSLQLVGEDGIDHTPRGERLRVKMGEASDVVAERTQVSARRVSDSESEASFKVVVRNRKKDDITATVAERFLGDWKITQESQEHKQPRADGVEYALDVQAEGEATVSFTVKIGFMPSGPPPRPGSFN